MPEYVFGKNRNICPPINHGIFLYVPFVLLLLKKRRIKASPTSPYCRLRFAPFYGVNCSDGQAFESIVFHLPMKN